MGIDVNKEAMKAAAIMNHYRMTRDDQEEIVRILMSAGVDACLQEQERIRTQNDALIAKAHNGLIH